MESNSHPQITGALNPDWVVLVVAISIAPPVNRREEAGCLVPLLHCSTVLSQMFFFEPNFRVSGGVCLRHAAK